MQRAPLALILAVPLALGACADDPDPNEVCGDLVVTRADPDVDFSSIQTFAELDPADYPEELPEDLPEDVEVNLAAAQTAARSQLLALGLTEVDPAVEQPDVYLFSLAASETDSGLAWQCVPGYVWWGLWGWVWDPCAWFGLVEVDYEVGSVIVGLADPETEEAVFGGLVQGALACENPRERLESGIQKIFASYPG